MPSASVPAGTSNPLEGVQRRGRDEVCRIVRVLCALTFVLALAGCGGGSFTPASRPQSPGGEADTVAVQLVIVIPVVTAAARVRPHYVSPATQSLSLVVQQGGTTVLTQTANLESGASGCTSTSGGLQCTVTIALVPGSYAATISTYDQPNAHGNLLSSGQNVPFTVSATSTSNTIPLTLSGVPASFVVTPQSRLATGSDITGFTIAGMEPVPFLVAALDADGNFIVGVGAPAFQITETAGSGWTMQNPTQAQPNSFSVTPSTANASTATLKATAVYPDQTCSLSGAVCGATFGVKNDLPTLFIAACGPVACGSGDAVLVYEPPYTGTPVATIASGIIGPTQMAVDAVDDLYVASNNINTSANQVTEYAPPYAGAPIATLDAYNHQATVGVQTTPDGKVFLTTYTEEVQLYSSIRDSTPYATLSTAPANSVPIALDPAQNMWVQTGNCTIKELAPPNYSTAKTSATCHGTPLGLAADGSGDVYIATTAEVAIAVASGMKSTYPLSAPGAFSVTYDPSGNAIAATQQGVLVLTPSATLSTTITNGVNLAAPPTPNPTSVQLYVPQLLGVENGYDIFVANNGSNTVTIYTPPYTGQPITVQTGGYVPQAVLLLEP